MELRPYLFCPFFCLLYFFLPPFEDNGLLFWVPDVLCWDSEVVLWNLLSVQMFFWWICGEKVVSLSYSSSILGLHPMSSSNCCFLTEIIVWFLSFNLLIWCIILIDLHILKNPCIPGINPAWSWCMSFLMCCQILFAKILFRIFAFMFISNIGR